MRFSPYKEVKVDSRDDSMIFPDIFDGNVMGFFTTKKMGSYVENMTGRKVYFPIQEHTDTVIELDSDMKAKTADAVVTDRFDVILGIKVADCVPVLVFDTNRLVIGAVHAGWRGTSMGILKKTINFLEYRYRSDPMDMLIAIGPSIGRCCYEVDWNVMDAVVHETGPGEYHHQKEEKFHLDLQAANRIQAVTAGVPDVQISTIQECTCCMSEKYNSYRRDGDASGRQGAFISLP